MMPLRAVQYLLVALALALCAPDRARAARIVVTPDLSIDLPDDWQHRRAVRDAAPEAVKAVLDCVDEDPERLLLGGWKLEGQSLRAAFCLSLWERGGGETLKLLKGPKKEEAFGKFADIFASKIHNGYKTRAVKINDLSATLVDAGDMAITTIDGRVEAGGRTFMRSDTVFLRGDAIVNVSTIYDLAAPDAGRQAEALPLSLEWR